MKFIDEMTKCNEIEFRCVKLTFPTVTILWNETNITNEKVSYEFE
jgi:hypothetical protein